MVEGTVIKLDSQKGSGAIRTEDGTEYGFTQTMVFKGKFKMLTVGSRVYFEPRTNPDMPGKKIACNIKVTLGGANPGPTSMPAQYQPHQGTNWSRSKTPLLPYGFVPVDVESAITDTPVWHDGSCPDDDKENGELLSGELRCTLTALTPLLPGNARYPVQKEIGSNKENVADTDLLKQWGFENLTHGKQKQIAEPLLLQDGNPNGRVVIPGSALKGMIRHSLSALVSAPMERVGDRHYTYRPNLYIGSGDFGQKFVCRPALVVAKIGNNWKVDVFDDARSAIFIRSDAVYAVQKAANANKEVFGVISGIRLLDNSKIISDNYGRETLNHRLAIYKGGIDGEGLLAGTAQKPVKTYTHALVPLEKRCTLDLPSDLYERYLFFQNDVLANSKIGHLTAHPHNNHDAEEVKAAIERSSKLQINQLIYIEVSTVNGQVTPNSRIVSFGHHFRYRWAYSSSVRKRDVHKGVDKVREYLKPKTCELVSDDRKNEKNIPPAQLSGARLVFGYVNNGDDNRFGTGVFERLAGRIAINHAISQACPEFLGESKNGYCLALPILGQPKSSAWEFYLRQDSNQAPATYGDLPSGSLGGDAGGELAGRKFYRHQPSVQGAADIATTDPEIIDSDQATLARFICKPGTQFKFAIRFSGLRSWELGALLVTLQPHRLLKNGTPTHYAHKLGLGRPLGMGSVRINIDAVALRSIGASIFETGTETDRLLNDATKVLASRLLSDAKAKSRLRLWMDIHAYRDLGKLDYPHEVNGTIFDWHTKLRREYSKLRRQSKPNWKEFFDKINERTKVPPNLADDDFIEG